MLTSPIYFILFSKGKHIFVIISNTDVKYYETFSDEKNRIIPMGHVLI